MDDKVKNTRIREIFQSMEYGESYENTENALEWIKSNEGTIFAYVEKSSETPNGIPTQIKNCVNEELLCTLHIPEIDTIKKIVSNSNNKTKWIDTKPLERAKVLTKLAVEIENNSNILAQIEIVSRGILSKDTKNKAVPLLAQYFYYYSSFAVKYNQENPNWKPEGIAVGVISNDNTLSNLGLMLAPALSAGYNIVLQVGTKLCPATALILELATKAGLPNGVLRLIPSNGGELLPYLSSNNVTILTLFVDLHNERYLGFNNFNKKILNLSSYKTPVIVFDDADLDSASASVIDSAWGYEGLLLWSVNTILVQENIFKMFLSKIKSKLRLLNVGLANNKMADISFPSQESVDKLDELVKKAKSQGIEVFQAEEYSNGFNPTLFIGGKVGTNRVLSADEEHEANVVSVVAFRSIDEAVNLANNSRQGLAAAIWSENIGVINEVTRKLKRHPYTDQVINILKQEITNLQMLPTCLANACRMQHSGLDVSNVWVNSHGLTAAEVTLCPIKDSGVGYFGGKEGFYEYVQFKNRSEPSGVVAERQKLNSSLASTVYAAKMAQENWYRTSKVNKGKLLQKFADFVDSNKKTLSATLSEKWLENWIVSIYECITESNLQNFSTLQLGFNVTSLRDPRGVVAIETTNELESHNIVLILGALIEGNSVILLNCCKSADSFYTDLSRKLPKDVLNVVPYNLTDVNTVAAHKELNAYFGEGLNPVFALAPLNDCKVFTNVLNDWGDVCNKVTFVKNIWSNIGKSSTCNY